MTGRDLGISAGILAVLLTFGYQNLRISRAEQRAAASALRADSTAAAADTTRRLVGRQFADSQAVWQRRVVQATQQRDALDRALGLERRAKADLLVRVAALDTALTGVTVDSADVRSATFRGTQGPYTINAAVQLPRPPAQAALQLGITLAPIPVGLRLSCGKAVQGIRPAQATVTSPPWATVELAAVTQDPGVCVSPALAPRPKARWPWFLGGLAVGVIGWEVLR